MNKRISFIGVGGQGTILATKLFSLGIVSMGYDIKMSEIHGSSQRGGSVTTQIIYGDKVYTPLLGDGEADMIVAFEKSEALRALPCLKKGGQIIMDVREINPLAVQVGEAEYPHQAGEELKRLVGADKVKIIKAAEIAEKLGNVRAQNVVLLGVLVKELGLTGVDWEKLVEQNVPEKSKELNLKAFNAGYSL
jgi:indolepyruvate ferredoxin oxidoreductase beta subunit